MDPVQFNGQTVEVVASATFSGGNYIGYTYDLATGLLLVSGTMFASPGVLVTDPSGNLLDQASGAVALSHRQFVGIRQVDVPWANSPLPDWLGPGWVGTYQGESRVEYDQSSGLPALAGQPVTVQQVIDRRVGNAVIGRELAQFGTTQGLPPTETTTDRAFGSAVFDGIWLPPESFTQMQPQQVLDQDPTTGRTVVFGGIQGGVAVVISSGQVDRLEQYYDVSSGLLTSSRYVRPMPGSGPNVTAAHSGEPGLTGPRVADPRPGLAAPEFVEEHLGVEFARQVSERQLVAIEGPTGFEQQVAIGTAVACPCDGHGDSTALDRIVAEAEAAPRIIMPPRTVVEGHRVEPGKARGLARIDSPVQHVVEGKLRLIHPVGELGRVVARRRCGTVRGGRNRRCGGVRVCRCWQLSGTSGTSVLG